MVRNPKKILTRHELNQAYNGKQQDEKTKTEKKKTRI